MPFFYEPHLDANIKKKLPKSLLLQTDSGKINIFDGRYEKFSRFLFVTGEELDCFPYGSFLLNKLPIYTEWSKLLDLLPGEKNVFALLNTSLFNALVIWGSHI